MAETPSAGEPSPHLLDPVPTEKFRSRRCLRPRPGGRTLEGEVVPIRHEGPVMGTEGVDRQQQKVAEFLRLLPLTMEIAGLPRAEANKYFNEGQMEVRVNT